MIIAAVFQFALIRRHSEYLAAHSASLLRAAIESTADGILVIDSENRVSTYNQHFASIGQLPALPDANARIAETLVPLLDRLEDAPAFMAKIAELEAHPETDSFDAFRFKDGTEIECYSLPQRLRGTIVGRVWSFRDVTAHRQAERDLLASRDNLEQKVHDRTAQLQSANAELLVERRRQADLIKQLAEAHQQLLQSEKMASIGQLAAGVAHEINNPIGFVSSNLTTLQKYTTDLMSVVAAYEQAEASLPADFLCKIKAHKQNIDLEFLRDDVGSLVSESIDGLQRVTRIVQDLKEFSHMGELAWRWANIEQGLDSTLNVAWNELKYKAEVVKDYGGIPEVECIPSQINQVFMNLLVNAAQAIEGRGQITLRTVRDGEGVRVEISDTGQGISDENLNRIFDPFFTTKAVGKGTGLGLSISYGIVQRHQGRIDVTSEVGKGSIFRVWLPVSRRGA
jgi:PAS domain S-box-containing protein